MSYHPLTDKIQSLLKENNIWFETFEHEPVRTSEEASKLRTGYTLDQGAKTAVVRVKRSGEGKFFVMIVLQGSKKFDKNKIKDEFGLFDLRFASEEEVAQITDGVLPGGIPPFGNLFGLQVYVDAGLVRQERIVFNAGDKSFSIGMKTDDYINLVKPIVGEIV